MNGIKCNIQMKQQNQYMETCNACVKACVPEENIVRRTRMRKPPCTNEDVKKAKNELNASKKHFKRRKTMSILKAFQNKEKEYENICETAKQEWANKTCDNIDKCQNPKQKWTAFHKLTSYQQNDGSTILPLYNKANVPVFDNKAKSTILAETFFGGEHIKNEEFDDTFKRKIDTELHNL
ncbi:hypothetical protein MAR_008376 [Mya arenaria]|uniref:Uncharacterized protein n=1 Tax=Mya arenaria TaxID=6604 RepID=A0ABY7DVT3_MYAAR|nr:hypothetical protein MAR_008376 [Mya arenaria]